MTRTQVILISTGIVALISLFVVIGMFQTVGVGQVGIVTQFGRVINEEQSGMHVIAPWQSLTAMNIQIQKEQQDAGAATHDLQSVTTTIALNYHLTADTANTVFRNVGVDYKVRIIDPVIQEKVKSVTAQYDAADLIAKRAEVETRLLDSLVQKLTDQGITVDNVSIVNFQFSSQFDQAIEQKQVAQQNAQKAQYELQTAQLKAQAQDVQAKTLTPEYLQLQAIERWDGKLPNYLGGGSVFNIPLQGN